METIATGSARPAETGPKKPIFSSPPLLDIPARSFTDAFTKVSDLVTPIPMSFVSSLFVEQDPYADCKSFSQLLPRTGQQKIESPVMQTPASQGLDINGLNEQASCTVSTRPSSARFKTMMPSRLPIPRSPYLTIPPGLSPTTLLDSPVLLSTDQAEPSPTTGTFPVPSVQVDAAQSSDKFVALLEQDGSSSFAFKPPISSLHTFGLPHHEVVLQAHVQVPSSTVVDGPIFEPISVEASPPLTTSNPQSQCEDYTLTQVAETSEGSSPLSLAPQAFLPPHLVERPSDDGYNWRKYGQKQVKGSEYPRSYYKCTHPSCSVKKKVERSYEGQITEIVYKGEHNHAKPQYTRRSSGASNGSQIVDGENPNLLVQRSGKSDELLSTARGSQFSYLNGTPETSLGSMSDDNIDDGADNEPDSKRRQIEKGRDSSFNAPLRTIREPRVIVQTVSEVDILDDGYRWRKYGQKVVKGNPHPRSYYKCTNLGCCVRKHVERSAIDRKAVITTYEGKHNHDVPMSRSSHRDINENATSVLPAPSLLGSTALVTLPTSAVSLQEQVFGKFGGIDPTVQDRLDSKMELEGEHLGEGSSFSFLHRDVGLKPKEEPEDVDYPENFLQPMYQSLTHPHLLHKSSYFE